MLQMCGQCFSSMLRCLQLRFTFAIRVFLSSLDIRDRVPNSLFDLLADVFHLGFLCALSSSSSCATARVFLPPRALPPRSSSCAAAAAAAAALLHQSFLLFAMPSSSPSHTRPVTRRVVAGGQHQKPARVPDKNSDRTQKKNSNVPDLNKRLTSTNNKCSHTQQHTLNMMLAALEIETELAE